jgi:molybdopterin/thiamine biosynthesis adenylyltransferase/rhodanese-related sulfurtransferase
MDARYSRQLALPGFGAGGQQRLGAARVLVIGAGGLGCSVIPALAGAGVGTIGVIDDDVVETSNLHRQAMHVGRVGESKAASAAATIEAFGVRAVPFADRLTSGNALDLFAGYDLVLDGSDNFPTRYLANDAAELAGIPLVWGAVSQYGGQAGISWAGTSYRDLFPVPPPPGSVPSCEVGGVLPTTVAVIGAIMASEAIKLITGVGEPLTGRVTTYDARSGAFRELRYARDPATETVTGLIDYDLFCGVGSTITPRQLAGREHEYLLVDVREPWEAAIASIPGSVLMPLGSIATAEIHPTRPVVTLCHHGTRSATARDLLADRGIEATSLAGGIDAWARDIDPSLARY